MIRYTLRCSRDHGFESWFRDSAAFDTLALAQQVVCPTCGSTEIRKALMTPSVVTGRGKSTPPAVPDTASAPPAAPDGPSLPSPVGDDRAQAMRAALREIRRRIVDSAVDVGRGFATEARAIHEGDAPARAIYGEATHAEVTALLEDDIPLLPMPPDDRH